MTERYPDKPAHASDGREFEALVEYLHMYFLNEWIGVFDDEWRQLNVGESHAGVECKHLARSFNYFHIEVAERTSIKTAWFPSGIMRQDNSTRYACGHMSDVFVFDKQHLREWRITNKPREVWYGKGGLGDVGDERLGATIHSYVLSKDSALEFALYRFRFQKGSWKYWQQETRR